MPGPNGADRDAAALLGGDIPFRPMSISEMLDGAVAGIRRHPRATLGLSVTITTVIQIAGSLTAFFLIGDQSKREVSPLPLLRSVGTQLTLGILGLVLSAYGIVLLSGFLAPVLARGIFEDRPTSLRQAWRDTRPRLGRLAVVALVVMGVALLGLLVPILPFILLAGAEAHPALIILAGLIGFPIGLGLMIWLYVLLVLAAPALVLERQSIGGALKRARTLSRGRWWRTCGTLLLALLITVFMGFFALRIPFLIVELFFDHPQGGELIVALTIDTLGRIVSWTVVLPFDAGVLVLLYLDRRMRREGLDLDLRTRPQAPAPAPAPAAEDDAAPEGTASEGPDDDGFFDQWRPSPLIERTHFGAPYDH
ncbi:glycerophosphoryl diester phosphodiesterase membrane domain-containing protein [Actinomadura barringtoniae]|uniref:Glycerophosphoryl diester phosphodiesterase membrane domain-containing protein n=1 Tax=Actinomadura barringtoniae TaxID=1427535 RepID=A0A939P958_9ACTN|nr:glycerophosphoryl diester phosphodiesterase membrane domain-containing protein [Actinomadura barringtoniae]MBO2448407.1 glycerophosphoryl diester phosphodiesterase membrane domain-containing protein [Actinomadura barringtoniae]